MHNKFEAENEDFGAGVCRRDYTDSNKKEFSSFKTLEGVRSGT